MTADKIKWLQILQGWAIMWVVIGHAPLSAIHTCPQPHYVMLLYSIAYSFHMPLFVFISGYLFYMTRIERYMPYHKMVGDKLMRLGIPYIIFTLMALIVKSAFPADMSRPATLSLNEFIRAIIYPGDGPLGELWFVATIMWFFIMRPIWCMNGWSRYLLTIILAIIFFIPDIPGRDFFCYKEVMRYAVFFQLGIVAKSEGLCHKNCTLHLMIMAFTSLLCSVCVSSDITVSLRLIIPLTGIIVSILISKASERYVPEIFSSFRDYSYQIYLMAIFFQIAVKILYKHCAITGLYSICFITCIIGGIYLPVLISMVIKKIDNKYLKLCIGLK